MFSWLACMTFGVNAACAQNFALRESCSNCTGRMSATWQARGSRGARPRGGAAAPAAAAHAAGGARRRAGVRAVSGGALGRDADPCARPAEWRSSIGSWRAAAVALPCLRAHVFGHLQNAVCRPQVAIAGRPRRDCDLHQRGQRVIGAATGAGPGRAIQERVRADA